jgi:hypothetical protein
MKFSRLFAASSALVLAAAVGVGAATLRQGPVQPDKMHAFLASHVGLWDAKVEMMGAESKATWEVKPGPGGLWTVSEFKGEMMGAPFHGMEFMGYDPAKGTFTSLWIDSSSAVHSRLEGKYDEAKKTMTLRGTVPGMDGNPAEMTHVTTFPDKDHMSFDMIGKGPDGADMKYMTIHYSRRK